MASRLTDSEKGLIIADYMETQSYHATALKFKRDDKTVKKIIEENPEFLKKSEQKREETAKSVLKEFENLKDTKVKILKNTLTTISNRLLEDAKKDKHEISMRELAIVYGTLIDKEIAYSQIKATENEEKELSKVDMILEEIKNAVK